MIKVVGNESKLKWKDIMKLAEDEDQQQEKTASKLVDCASVRLTNYRAV